jgi:hypothetical protein
MDQTTLQLIAELPGLQAARVAIEARIEQIEAAVSGTPRRQPVARNPESGPVVKKAVSQARLDGLARARAVKAKKQAAEKRAAKKARR